MSVKLAPLSKPAFGFVRLKVSVEVSPLRIGFVPNDLLMLGAPLTVSVSLPPLTLSGAAAALSTLVVLVPLAVALTSTVTVQLPDPGISAVLTSKLPPPATAVCVTLAQSPPVTSGVAFTMPAG